eukprot:gene11911-10294_t
MRIDVVLAIWTVSVHVGALAPLPAPSDLRVESLPAP